MGHDTSQRVARPKLAAIAAVGTLREATVGVGLLQGPQFSALAVACSIYLTQNDLLVSDAHPDDSFSPCLDTSGVIVAMVA